jgi:hypothetical protein
MTATDELEARLALAVEENAYRRQLRAAKRQPVQCAGCGRAFMPRRSNQRYHSAACRQKAYRLRST